MKRIPVIATIIVLLAVAAMIALGVWQLDRLHQKQTLLARYAANAQSPVMAYPVIPDDALLFRRVSLFCLEPVKWTVTGAGNRGFRHIADCRTGAEGPAIAVDVGSTRDPAFKPHWAGGDVTGTLTYAPDSRSILGKWLTGGANPQPLMVVAEQAAPGLTPDPRPDPASVPNNHLAYAVQWFLFAAIALIIYGLALRRRARGEPPPAP